MVPFMKKKMVSMLLAAAITAGTLAGCSGSGTQSGGEAAPASETQSGGETAPASGSRFEFLPLPIRLMDSDVEV